MPDIRFSTAPTTANDLCQKDPESLEQFLACNPQVASGTSTLPGHFAYDVGPAADVQSRIITQQFNSLPISSRQNLQRCVANYGDDLWPLIEFYDRNLSGFELPSAAEKANGLAGGGIAVAHSRATSFQNALVQYQEALVQLNRYTKVGRVAGAQRIQLRQKVTDAYNRLNRHFEQEMRRIVPAQNRNRNRGSALSNSDRGITLAERSRGRGIHVADMHEGQKVSRFTKALRYGGRGIIALDLGFRGARVHSTYEQGGNWERELAVQTGGLVGASLGGVSAGQLAVAASRVALAATPFGWGVIIASSIVTGAVLAYQGDKQFQSWVGTFWDKIFGE